MARLTPSLLLDKMCRVMSVVINVLMCVGALCLFCLYLLLTPPALWSSYAAFYSVHAPGRTCMMVLYGFVCAVQRSICHLFGVKGWPTFSRSSALCSGWVGAHWNTVYDSWTWTSHEQCYIAFSALHIVTCFLFYNCCFTQSSLHVCMLSQCLMIDC